MVATERRHQASDGYEFISTTWSPVATARGRVLVLHGIQSHAGWYGKLGEALAAAGFFVEMPDRRGSGRNRGRRGHASGPRRLLDDLRPILQAWRAEDASAPIAVAGISWGAKVAALLAAKSPTLVDGLTLITPGFHPVVKLGAAALAGVAASLVLRLPSTFAIPLGDPALFTSDPEWQRFIAEDPLTLHRATAEFLATSQRLDRSALRALPAIRQPTLVLLAGSDRIMDNARTRRTLERLGGPARTIEYPEAHHTLEFEPDGSRYARDLIDWMSALPARTVAAGELSDAEGGHA